jgi:hypothetical protein
MAVKIGYEVIDRVKAFDLQYPAVGVAVLRVFRQLVVAKISDGSIYLEPDGQPVTFPQHDYEQTFTLDVGADPTLVTNLLAVIARVDALK